MRSERPGWICALIAGLAGFAAAQPVATFEVIARSGDTPGGLPAGVSISQFGRPFVPFGGPAINENGELWFVALLQGAGVTDQNNAAVIRAGLNGSQVLVRDGDPAPGTEPGTEFGSLNSLLGTNVRWTSSGDLAVSGLLRGPSVTDENGSGIWLDRGSGLELLLRRGTQAPLLPAGEVITGIGLSWSSSNTGLVSAASLNLLQSVGQPPVQSSWILEGSDLRLIATERLPVAVGVLPFALSDLRLTDSGVVAGMNSGTLYLWEDGIRSIMAQPGDPVPSLPAGTVLDDSNGPRLGLVSVAGSGQSLLYSRLAGPGIDGSNNNAVILSTRQGLRVVAREGDQAPGRPIGQAFSTPSGSSEAVTGLVTSQGDSAFSFALSNVANPANSMGIWAEIDGRLRLVAQAGEPAPGTEPGTVWDQYDLRTPSESFVFDQGDDGTVVLAGSLVGPGINLFNDRGLWAHDRFGRTRLIIREGDMIDIDPDPNTTDIRRVLILDVRTENDFVNARGQFAFQALVEGGAGIVVRGTLRCPADLTGSSDPNDPSFGVPDGDADGDDFFFYLDAFSASNLGVCDLTGSSDPNEPSFGSPDGDCDGDDFFFYLDLFVGGCP
ncbi:MAG: choice-of-anchor tandem repeat NxxGxxAF-containing protein [Phycisphaerales bacterium JB037]